MTFSVLLIKPLSAAKINVGVKAKSTLWFPNMHQSAETHPETSSPFGICNWCYFYLLFINPSLGSSGCDWNSMTLLLFCFLGWSSKWLVDFNPLLLPSPTHSDGTEVTMAPRWLPVCAFSWWHFSSLAGGWEHVFPGRAAERSQGQCSVLSAWAAWRCFCTCWACAPAKGSSVRLCLARRGEGGFGNRGSTQGGSRAPCLSCSQPHCPGQPILGLSWGGWAVQVLSPLAAFCGWLLQLCWERHWSRCCLCSFPSIARSVQERGWDGVTSACWSLVTLCKHSLALLHQERIPGGNPCTGHWQQSHTSQREPHRQTPELEASWAASVPRHPSAQPCECPSAWHSASGMLVRISAYIYTDPVPADGAQRSLTLCHAQTWPFSQQTSHQLPVDMLFTFFLPVLVWGSNWALELPDPWPAV